MAFDYSRLSLGELIDMLSIVNIKIFMLVEGVMQAPEDIESMDFDSIIHLAKCGKKAQILNSQRSALKNQIDRVLEGLEMKDVKY